MVRSRERDLHLGWSIRRLRVCVSACRTQRPRPDRPLNRYFWHHSSSCYENKFLTAVRNLRRILRGRRTRSGYRIMEDNGYGARATVSQLVPLRSELVCYCLRPSLLYGRAVVTCHFLSLVTPLLRLLVRRSSRSREPSRSADERFIRAMSCDPRRLWKKAQSKNPKSFFLRHGSILRCTQVSDFQFRSKQARPAHAFGRASSAQVASTCRPESPLGLAHSSRLSSAISCSLALT